MRAMWVGGVMMLACGGRALSPDAGPTPDDAQVRDAFVDGPDADEAATPRVITMLADKQQAPCELAVDSKSVYWTNCGVSVMKCPVTGGKLTTLVSSQLPGGFAIDATSLYWINIPIVYGSVGPGGLIECSLAGCGAGQTTLAPEHQTLGKIAADATSLYFFWGALGNNNQQTLGRCAKSGCLAGSTALTATAIASTELVVHGTQIFWTQRGNRTIATCSTSGCAIPSTFASKQDYPTGIAVDDTNVYWTNQAESGAVMKAPLKGGAPTVLADGQSYPTGIATDGISVYWTNQNDGTVMKCAVDGCGDQPETLVSDQSYPNRIAVDADSVYWTTTGTTAFVGTIMKVTPK
jgi:hypothetical protein